MDSWLNASQEWLQREQRMQEAFFQQAKTVPKRIIEEDQRRIGLENEYVLVDEDGPVKAHKHIEPTDRVHLELGQNQVELTTPPLQAGPKTLSEAVQLVENTLDEQTQHKEIFREPVNPWVSVNEVSTTPTKEKYERVPAWADDNQGRILPATYSGVTYTEPRCVGLFQGLHVNAQAQSLDDAINMLNNAYAYAPLTSLISGRPQRGNKGRIIEHDVRPLAWEAAHDYRTLKEVRSGVPSRFGVPSQYMPSWTDYCSMISEQPFILNDEEHEDDALQIALGMDWRDARLKIRDDRPIVEVRTPPVQPSPKQDGLVATTIAASLHGDQDRPPTQYVSRQRENVLREGTLRDTNGPSQDTYIDSFKASVKKGLAHYDVAESAVMPWLNARLDSYAS